MKPVIEVRNISKSYQISHQEKASYDTIKDDFAKLIKKPFGGGPESEKETFWALKDINFQVNQGEAFGIVGKNGSGKSTLLKILSRIVDPTSGTVKIHGKVASLLEVGTGFHPELTGRENIYFNGSMIGMSKQEINRKFNEIVEFSGVEQFLDTPVKFYSSGMYVRLAFSVAAHLESEILIIDEVLSVGDAAFQKKSLAKMLSIAKQGRTILFVSHSMSAVEEICTRSMLLEKGSIKVIGDTETVTEKYMLGDSASKAEREAYIAARKEADLAKSPVPGVRKSGRKVSVQAGQHVFSNFKVNNESLDHEIDIISGKPIKIEAEYTNGGSPFDLLAGYGLRNISSGDFPIFVHNKLENVFHQTGKNGRVVAELLVPKLAPGNYSLEIYILLDDKTFVESTQIGSLKIGKTIAFSAKEELTTFPSSVLIDSKWKISKDK